MSTITDGMLLLLSGGEDEVFFWLMKRCADGGDVEDPRTWEHLVHLEICIFSQPA